MKAFSRALIAAFVVVVATNAVGEESIIPSVIVTDDDDPVVVIDDDDPAVIDDDWDDPDMHDLTKLALTTVGPVPYAWINRYYPDSQVAILGMSGDEVADYYETKAEQTAANGENTVAEAYVAGLDPTKKSSVFKTCVVLSNGMVYVNWSPNLNADGGTNRIYTLSGRQKLDEGDWETPAKPWHRFFKVAVALPASAYGTIILFGEDEESAVANEGFLPLDEEPGVQLWENGPYWAECNVGASKPEEYGYYFWWGDTVGYMRTAANGGWVSVKDGSSFEFSKGNCPTFNKSISQLKSDGYIDSTTNLVAAHDAATAHLGKPWRMPTDAEMSALVSNCDTTWTTTNGVYGRLVRGRGNYSTKSIFLPAAGFGDGASLGSAGALGDYWSSTPISDSSDYAWYLFFYSGNFARSSYGIRYAGLSVRPLRGFAK